MPPYPRQQMPPVMPPFGPPPPLMMPMMMPPFGPPPPPRRSGIRTLFRTVVVVMLAASLLINLMMFSSSTFSGRSAMRNAVKEGDPHEVIAVIPVSGMILDRTADQFNKWLALAEKDPYLKAVVVAVDTPGGAVTPSDVIYHRIRQFKADHPATPVVVSMGGLATSGGYYLSAAADQIVAQPTTLTGNIGVLMPRYNLSTLAEKWGIHETTVTAPKNGFKNAGSMFAPETEADKEYLQTLIDGAYKRFLTVVRDGRGPRLKKPVEQIADGKVYTADRALADGLIDQIGFPDDAYAYAARQAGLSRPMVIKYHDQPSLLDLLGGESKFDSSGALTSSGGGGSAGVTINGVNVNLNDGTIEALKTPRLLYMWQGQ